MRFFRMLLLTLATAGLLALPAAGAAADTVKPLRQPPPKWMTSKKVRDRIAAAGTEGVRLSTIRKWVRAGLAGRKAQQQPVTDPCLNGDPRTGVNAGACQVYPYGCTANFIFHKGEAPFAEFSDGRHYFIGTAGHCVNHANEPVFMEIAPAVVAKVGEVEKILAGDIGRNGRGNGGLGNDFTIIEIDQGLKVNPEMPAASGGGPEGIYTGCTPPQVAKYWGHGYAAAVGPGKTETGVVTRWYDRSYAWAGAGFPGDSGSGVLLTGPDTFNQAAGNLTHLVVGDTRYPGNLVGTRLTRALTWMGGEYYLVNEDRSYSRATMAETECANANNGAGGDIALP